MNLLHYIHYQYNLWTSHSLHPFSRYLNLYAEESALDDAIYYLAEALRNDVIDIQVFLKVRSFPLGFFIQIQREG